MQNSNNYNGSGSVNVRYGNSFERSLSESFNNINTINKVNVENNEDENEDDNIDNKVTILNNIKNLTTPITNISNNIISTNDSNNNTNNNTNTININNTINTNDTNNAYNTGYTNIISLDSKQKQKINTINNQNPNIECTDNLNNINNIINTAIYTFNTNICLDSYSNEYFDKFYSNEKNPTLKIHTENEFEELEIENIINTHFLDIKDLSLLKCNICTFVLTKAVECSKCDKCICKPCLDKMFNNNVEKHKKCPYCLKNSKFKKVNKPMRDFLSSLLFICPKGCWKSVKYEDYFNHVQNCTGYLKCKE